ncbi:MAG: DUF1929 domain-containing protein [Pseudomonadota bacterium]|nr:DUF1929 domain-containing protein [Pseudomonadota bacterium]
MKRVYFVSYLMMLCTLGVVDAAALAPGADAHIKGVFGDPFTWPIIPIHAALLPNGKIYSYGTDTAGTQGATLWHDLWDPKLGTAASAHTLLPNTTPTDTFCAAQALLPNTGRLMMTGGDAIVNGQRNWSNYDTNVYDPGANVLVSSQPMFHKRWYPTLLALTNGNMLVLGGRSARSTSTAAATYGSIPEVYTPATGWKTLSTAKSNLAYGSTNGSWYYPRAFPAPNGQVFILAHHGEMFYLNPTGTGSIKRATSALAPGSNGPALPSVHIAPGKILSLRKDKKVIIVDLNKSPPTFTATAPVSSVRDWSNATVLADGKVMVSGGSRVRNNLPSAIYAVEIWDPATGKWTLGAAAQKPRLYHSIALLLPDASVLTAGGGAPGPVKNLNGEKFYPPYLWKADGSGQLASRPSIVSAPGTVVLGGKFFVTVPSGDSIKRVTLVRKGSVTHSFDAATSFTALSFTQSGGTLTVTAPKNANVAMPGYWMIFVINQNGVPSVAKNLRLTRP